MQTTVERAYAKVNLHLGVAGKNSDGYHSVSTVMHSLSLFDKLTVSVKKSSLPEIKLRVLNDPAVPEDSRNLVWKAAEAFMRETGITCAVSVRLEKHIPSQAGLGGGSSDAAALLRAINRLLGYPLKREDLMKLATELGSDVPFCLVGGTALCTGRGDVLTPIDFAGKLYAVIAKSNEAVSTPNAYAALDRCYGNFDGSIPYPPQSADPVLSAMNESDPEALSASLYNVFESVIYEQCPGARALRDALVREGASAALLSGSGSAVFGLFGSLAEARKAAKRIGSGAVAVESAPPARLSTPASRLGRFCERMLQWGRGLLRIGSVQCVLISLLLNFLIETVSRRSLISAISFTFFHPLYFLSDFSLIFLTMSLALFFRKRAFVYILVSVIWFALGMTNGILILVRTAPFEAVDFSILRTGLGIITVYMEIWQIVLLAILILAVIAWVIFLGIRMRKQERSLRAALIGMGASAVTALALILPLNLAGGYPPSFPNLSAAYDEYGFTYCFVCSIFDRGVDKPEGYGKGAILELLAEMDSKRPETVGEREPNIIFLQLESFIDVSRLKESSVQFSEHPTPFFSELKETYSSGLLRVPTIGAGTANTEFEVVTGMSHHDFGTGEYPYKSFLRKKACESVPFLLRKLGYGAHAIHNHTATFYERNKAYAYLGFETFTPLEYMTDVTYNELGWAKDEVLTAQIMNALGSTEGSDVVLAVSVQGHGKYAKMSGTPKVTVSSSVLKNDVIDGMEYYVNQLYEMDHFLKELTETLSASGEDTVLVIYGDHLPSLGLEEAHFEKGDLYQTDYVIWTSFASERTERDLASYQLAAHALGEIGISVGNILRLHQMKYDEGIDEYELERRFLEYDMLNGELYAYGGRLPYRKTQLKMGVLPITITEVKEVQGGILVLGENFTEASTVAINGKKKDTEYRSSGELFIKSRSLKSGDKVTVLQITEDRVKLGSTPSYRIGN